MSAPDCFSSSSGIGEEFLTAKQKSRAALADCMPNGEFSTAQPRAGESSSRCIAASYGCGDGLPSRVSCPVTITSNKLRRSFSRPNICATESEPVTKPNLVLSRFNAVNSSLLYGKSFVSNDPRNASRIVPIICSTTRTEGLYPLLSSKSSITVFVLFSPYRR